MEYVGVFLLRFLWTRRSGRLCCLLPPAFRQLIDRLASLGTDERWPQKKATNVVDIETGHEVRKKKKMQYVEERRKYQKQTSVLDATQTNS